MVAAAAVAGPLAAGCGGGEGSSGGTNNRSIPASISNAVVSVPVSIEGTMTMPLLLDTGSSTMVLEAALYDAIVADGRAQSAASVATIMGTENVPSTKLRDVSLAGAAQANVAAVRSPLDMSLLEREVGHPVQGLVGG